MYIYKKRKKERKGYQSGCLSRVLKPYRKLSVVYFVVFTSQFTRLKLSSFTVKTKEVTWYVKQK